MRGPLIAGIDTSTLAIHCALIPVDPGVHAGAELRSARIKRVAKGAEAERLRNVRRAMHHVLRDTDDGCEIVAVFIERPPHFLAQKGRTELIEVYGAACASTPLRIETVGGLTPAEWRSKVRLELEPGDRIGRSVRTGAWKEAAIRRVTKGGLWLEADYPCSEHEAEAILVAIAGRGMYWTHHEAGKLAKGVTA